MSETLLDLRGMRCPWPALRVARAMREGRAPIIAIADDANAPREIGALAQERGWRVESVICAMGEGIRVTPS